MNLVNQDSLKCSFKLLFCSFVLGGLSILAFSPFDFLLALPLSFALLAFICRDSTSYKMYFAFFYAYGLGFYVIGLYWISNALLLSPKFYPIIPFALLALPSVLALYHGLYGMLFMVKINNIFLRCLFLACSFVVIEFLRSILFSGFPWNLYGYSFASFVTISQICSIVGIYGLSFLAIYLALSFAFCLMQPSRAAFINFIIVIALILLCHLWGEYRIKQNNLLKHNHISVMVVQPNTGKEMISQAYIEKSLQDVMNHSVAGYKGENLVIWPESANKTIVDLKEAELYKTFHQITDFMLPASYLIFGSPSYKEGHYYNSILVSDQEGQIKDHYHKSKLVPFGEFIPFRDILPIQNIVGNIGDFSAGEGIKPVKAGDNYFIPLVCYEAVLPNLHFAREGASFIVNATNDNWYGNSIGPYQHATMARIKAIEFGLPMVRSAVSGISFITDSYGREIKSLGLGEVGVISAILPAALPETPFLQYNLGLKFVILNFIIAFYLWVVVRRN